MEKHTATFIRTAIGTVIGAAMLASLVAGCDRPARQGSVPESSGSSTAGSSASGSGSASDSGATSSRAGATGDSSGTSASTSTGSAVNDSAVTAKVKAALLADSDLRSMGITVDTTDGVVTLSGSVNNQAQIERAQHVASAVGGVRDVRNSLAIKR